MSGGTQFEDEDGTTYDLVMPFVVCKTQGGPYEDEAFVAGSWFGRLDTLLQANAKVGCDVKLNVAVPTPLLPQLDLLAMHHGFELTAKPWDEAPDEHSFVTFTQSVASEDAGDPS